MSPSQSGMCMEMGKGGRGNNQSIIETIRNDNSNTEITQEAAVASSIVRLEKRERKVTLLQSGNQNVHKNM